MEGIRVDGHFAVTDQEATTAARLLASEAGILAGYSSGAHLRAAIELLRVREKGNTLAFMVRDTGMKYLSTELYP